MPSITFESHDGEVTKTVSVPEGGALADVIDDAGAPIPFSCRSASCASCRVEVLEGHDAFLAPDAEEREILEVVSLAPPRFRMACQAKLKPGDTLVRIRAQCEY